MIRNHPHGVSEREGKTESFGVVPLAEERKGGTRKRFVHDLPLYQTQSDSVSQRLQPIKHGIPLLLVIELPRPRRSRAGGGRRTRDAAGGTVLAMARIVISSSPRWCRRRGPAGTARAPVRRGQGVGGVELVD